MATSNDCRIKRWPDQILRSANRNGWEDISAKRFRAVVGATQRLELWQHSPAISSGSRKINDGQATSGSLHRWRNCHNTYHHRARYEGPRGSRLFFSAGRPSRVADLRVELHECGHLLE